MSNQTIVSLLRDIVGGEASFFVRAIELPEPLRNRVLANRSRQTALLLDIVRILVEPPRPVRSVVNRGFTIDITPEILRTFNEPVPVIPTAEQIEQAVEQDVEPPVDTMCAICQETVVTSTRLVQCHHHFHHACITQWFSTSVRCPVCRNDIREVDGEDV